MEVPSETLRLTQNLGTCWRSNSLTSPELPPLAIAEALQDNVSCWYKIRRLHLIIVDAWSPWQFNTAQVRAVTDLMKHLADTPEMAPNGSNDAARRPVPPRCRRFVYGYALDHSEFPARSSPVLETSCREENSEIGSESGRSFFSPPGSASKLSSDTESSEISKTLLFFSV